MPTKEGHSELQVEQNIPKKQFLPVNYAGLFTVNDQNETKIKICLKWSYKYEAYKLSYDEPDESYQAAGGFIVLQVLLKFLLHGSIRISTGHLWL